jgi:hypothetical protein
MKKLLLLALLTLCTFSYAKMVNGIACIVEGECITSAEIRAIQTQYSIPKEKALNLLIQDRLQKSAMRDIVVDETVIDSKISAIAAQNNLTVPKMQKILKTQGTSWETYRSSIRNAIRKEKFFQEHIINNIPEPSNDELKLYYTNHKKQFVIPSTVNLIEYSAKSEQKMKDFLRTKNTKKVKSHQVKKSTKDLNPTLLSTILQTQNGSYTRPFNAGDKYISYKILSKSGEVTMPFESAISAITARWKRAQQSRAIKDYFEKLKTNADIQYIKR